MRIPRALRVAPGCGVLARPEPKFGWLATSPRPSHPQAGRKRCSDGTLVGAAQSMSGRRARPHGCSRSPDNPSTEPIKRRTTARQHVVGAIDHGPRRCPPFSEFRQHPRVRAEPQWQSRRTNMSLSRSNNDDSLPQQEAIPRYAETSVPPCSHRGAIAASTAERGLSA